MKPRQTVLYSFAAVAAAWSGWIVTHRDAENSTVGASVRRPAAVPAAAVARTKPAAPARSEIGVNPGRSTIATQPSADTFAARSWVPPLRPPLPPKVIAAPPPPPAPPAPPPVLPYRLVGLIDDPKVGRLRVFLSLNDKLLVASAGDTLEGGFRLDSISPQEIVFTHIERNVTLKLSVQGASS
jgi:hypothetical protein